MAPQRPLLQAARVAESAAGADAGRVPWLLSVQRDTLDLWQLGTAARGGGARGTAVEGGLINAAVQPLHMARLANKGGRHVLAAALAPDGRYLAYSDTAGVKCLRLSEQLGTDAIPVPHLGLAPVHLPAAAAAPARLLAFRPGSAQLLAAGMDGTVRLVDLAAAESESAGAPRSKDGDGGGDGSMVLLRALHDLRYKPHARRDRGRSAARWALPPLELMAPSPDGRWLAAVVRGRVQLLNLATGRLVQLPPVVPEGQLPVTALRFLPSGSRLVAATSAQQGSGVAHQLALYDVEAGVHSEWSLALQQGAGSGGGAAGAQPGLPPRLRCMPGLLVHVSPRPGMPHAALLQSAAALCQLDVACPLSQEPRGGGGGAGGGRKQRRAHKPVPLNGAPGENGRLLYGDKVLLFAEYIGPSALLLVERTWEEAWADVPAPLQRHRFGS